MVSNQEDHWSSEAYQNSASFVPKLATKVLSWLDAKPDDHILDIGCGDGVIPLQIAQTLSKGNGKIHGIDSSVDMITNSQKAASADPAISPICTFEVLDATKLIHKPALQQSRFDKVFSNAAMHWILKPESGREPFFRGVHGALRPGGTFGFEMGGMGNVAEIRAVLLSTIGRRVGLEKAVATDPWFFPDEEWMKEMLEEKIGGFRVERVEREFRPTRVDKGGIEGWVRLMGKQFFDVLGVGERDECVREVCGVLEEVCRSPSGGDWIGYVRLRCLAVKM